MSEKLPAFQFYPADWRKDPGVQSLTFEERGVWLEIICLMHESPRRGVLLMPNGSPMTNSSLSRILGIQTPKLVKILDRLNLSGVSSLEGETGAIINRRMVKDEALRQLRGAGGQKGAEYGHTGGEFGKRGGRPPKGGKDGAEKPPLEPPLKPPPSSSSSSSSSSSEEEGNISGALFQDIDNDKDSPVLGTIPATAVAAAGPPAEKTAAVQPFKKPARADEAAELFRSANLKYTEVPYKISRPDMVALADLRKLYKIGTTETPPGWQDAVVNYFGSTLLKYTQADLCNRYSIFKNSPLDRNGPTNHRNHRNESAAEARDRRRREALNTQSGNGFPN